MLKLRFVSIKPPKPPFSFTEQKKHFLTKDRVTKLFFYVRAGAKPLRLRVEVVSGVNIQECHSHLEQQRLEVFRAHSVQFTLYHHEVTVV